VLLVGDGAKRRMREGVVSSDTTARPGRSFPHPPSGHLLPKGEGKQTRAPVGAASAASFRRSLLPPGEEPALEVLLVGGGAKRRMREGVISANPPRRPGRSFPHPPSGHLLPEGEGKQTRAPVGAASAASFRWSLLPPGEEPALEVLLVEGGAKRRMREGVISANRPRRPGRSFPHPPSGHLLPEGEGKRKKENARRCRAFSLQLADALSGPTYPACAMHRAHRSRRCVRCPRGCRSDRRRWRTCPRACRRARHASSRWR
jgi:hypothetical protein